MATADTKTELTTCCGARATYMDTTLVCKSCYGEVEWSA